MQTSGHPHLYLITIFDHHYLAVFWLLFLPSLTICYTSFSHFVTAFLHSSSLAIFKSSVGHVPDNCWSFFCHLLDVPLPSSGYLLTIFCLHSSRFGYMLAIFWPSLCCRLVIEWPFLVILILQSSGYYSNQP